MLQARCVAIGHRSPQFFMYTAQKCFISLYDSICFVTKTFPLFTKVLELYFLQKAHCYKFVNIFYDRSMENRAVKCAQCIGNNVYRFETHGLPATYLQYKAICMIIRLNEFTKYEYFNCSIKMDAFFVNRMASYDYEGMCEHFYLFSVHDSIR